MFLLADPRIRLVALAGGACLIAAVAVTSACLTDPPPDLTSPSSQGPVIVDDALRPPADGTLTQWPADNEFLVPVRNVDPSNCQYSVTFSGEQNGIFCQQCAGFLDAGVLLIPLNLTDPFDPTLCNESVTFYVATHFIRAQGGGGPQSCTAYDNGQGDSARWRYSPPPCMAYDAGAVQDGAFPRDGASDGLPAVPDSGTE
jgi:hypothetical protein